jgi:DNA modification methylase
MRQSKPDRSARAPAEGKPHWPADRVERRAVSSLTPYARNARQHSPAQVAQLADSIRQWGWTMPVLVDEAGEIIAGHGRVMAAERLGLVEVPVMTAVGWSAEQKRAYVIADNKLALNADWDSALLTLELGDLKAAGFDLGLMGFDAIEADELFARAALKAGLSDEDETPELPAQPVSRRGDVWLLGNHRLGCGDATDAVVVERLLAGAKPHLMVTDPPYGVDYDVAWRLRSGLDKPHQTIANGQVTNDKRADWSAAWALFSGDVAYVWHGSTMSDFVATSLRAQDFDIRAQIIWVKSSPLISRGAYHWQHEPCWYAVRKGKTGHWAGDRKQSTVWSIPTVHRTQGDVDDGRTNHSTQKPVEAMRRPIENNSRAGQSVYEPFSGSGTTIIACEQTGRRALAIELEPAYVDMAVLRWQKFSGEEAMLDGTGQGYASVKETRDAAGAEAQADDAEAAARRAGASRAADRRAARRGRAVEPAAVVR